MQYTNHYKSGISTLITGTKPIMRSKGAFVPEKRALVLYGITSKRVVDFVIIFGQWKKKR